MANPNDRNDLNDPYYSNINDPAYTVRNPRIRADEDRSYGRWIIGALVAVAVIMGIMFLLPTSNPNTASNNNNGLSTSSPARPAPATTTGSGSSSPATQNPNPTPAPRQ
jgi:hypothetical protein